MRGPTVPTSCLPAELQQEPPEAVQCKRCGKPIFWGVRAEGGGRTVPVEPASTNRGTLIVNGFVTNTFNAIVPRMSDTGNHASTIPYGDELPEWARKKRRVDHAPLCAAPLAPLFANTTPRQPVKRVRVSDSRETVVDELIATIKKRLPTYSPSQRFMRACDDYKALKIGKDRLVRELILEDEQINFKR